MKAPGFFTVKLYVSKEGANRFSSSVPKAIPPFAPASNFIASTLVVFKLKEAC
jgi:hypothetical protein